MHDGTPSCLSTVLFLVTDRASDKEEISILKNKVRTDSLKLPAQSKWAFDFGYNGYIEIELNDSPLLNLCSLKGGVNSIWQ